MNYLKKYKQRLQQNGRAKSNREYFIDRAEEDFEFYLNDAPNVFDIKIYKEHDKTYTCSIVDISEAVVKSGDEKTLLTERKNEFQIGDVLDLIVTGFNSRLWMVIFEENLAVHSHRTFRIRPINHILKFINKNGEIIEQPCIVTNRTLYTLGVHDHKEVIEGDSRFSIMIPYTEDSKFIRRDNRFVINNLCWKVTNVDTVSNKGIVDVLCGETPMLEGIDDMENEIANRWKSREKHNYHFYYDKEITVKLGEQVRSNLSIQENGKNVFLPTEIMFGDNDKKIDTEHFNIAIDTGQVPMTIIVHGEDQDYNLDINVNIIDDTIPTSQIHYTYEIKTNMSCEIKKYNTNTFEVIKKLNGEIVDSYFDYEIDYKGIDKSDITVKKVTEKIVKIKNNKCVNGEEIKLTFIDLDNKNKKIVSYIKLIK